MQKKKTLEYITLEDLKRKLFKNKKVREEYERLAPEYEVIRSVIAKRIEKKWSQKKLAGKIGTKQSAIARFESGTYNPSIAFLQKIATALKAELKISLD